MPHRQVVRGSSAAFEVLFLEPDGTPLVPIDQNYPQVSVEDATGVVLSTSVGNSLNEGRYRFVWFVPVDTKLTSCDETYKITWTMVTANNQQSQNHFEFQVIDSVEVNPTERAYTYLTMQGEAERLFIRFGCAPQELSLIITAPDCTQLAFHEIKDFTEVSDQGQSVFYLDTPPLTGVGSYIVVWKSRQTTISPAVTSVQQLRVPETKFYYVAPSLRMLLDKAQKKIGLAQAYSDPDIYEYLKRGIEHINAETPISSWSLASVPIGYGMNNYLLLASAVWGLRAQFLSEGELAFGFSGQTVTLDVDRTSTYESMISNIMEYLNENLSKTKRNLLRQGSVGAYAGRSYDFGLSSLVTPVAFVRGGNQQLLPMLSRLGII